MLTIGEFARLGGVSVRTVRYYDQIGLLPAAHVDAATGYRYFSAASLARLHRVIALKELGLSLHQISDLVDDLSSQKLLGMLAMKRLELEAQAAEAAAQLGRVERRLRYIEMEDQVLDDVVVKDIPAMRVVAIACPPAPATDFDAAIAPATDAFISLFAAFEAAGAEINPPGIMFYEEADGVLTAFAALPSAGVEVTGDGVRTVELPAIKAATYVQHGRVAHDVVGPIYGALHEWAEKQGYAPKGWGRDLLIDVADLDNGVVELQLPLR